MLEAVKYANIRDICVKDLYYYEKEKEAALIEFCNTNSISYIPAKNRKSCWRLKGNQFVHVPELPKDLVCKPEDLIFADATFNKFNSGNHDEVMFVVEDDLIKGIVHIVDYNNDDLFVALYRMLLNFEYNIRKLLIHHKKSNNDFLNWMKKEGKKNSYYRGLVQKAHRKSEVEKRKNANPFQTFYLKDLLLFARSEDLFQFTNKDLNDLTGIRNWIAHSKDVTHIQPNKEHAVYNIDGLRNFIKMSQSFFTLYEKLELTLEKNDSENGEFAL